jgi:hypothetical protein
MSDHVQADPSNTSPADAFNGPLSIDISNHRGLPPWLARHLLRADEEITWIRGPRWNPRWERYVTHPVLVFYALGVGVALVVAGRLIAGSWSELTPLLALAAAALVLGCLFVVGICAGYFTRLVVTNFRVVIVQGYAVCRSWSIKDLPPSLVRYEWRGRKRESQTVDLEALQSMLGGASEQFATPKKILAFGKQLDGIKARESGRL